MAHILYAVNIYRDWEAKTYYKERATHNEVEELIKTLWDIQAGVNSIKDQKAGWKEPSKRPKTQSIFDGDGHPRRRRTNRLNLK